MKKTIIFIVLIITLIALVVFVFDWGRKGPQMFEINSGILTEDILHSSNSTIEMPIVVNNIEDNQEVSNPIKIEGKARGNWFFEASFPVELIDTDGNILASAIATAESDWMTTEFVNFTVNLEYDKPTSTRHALLILSKDNPSDNPEFDQSIFIPVILK